MHGTQQFIDMPRSIWLELSIPGDWSQLGENSRLTTKIGEGHVGHRL